MVKSTAVSCYSNDPVIQTRTIILWTELFPKKRKEKIQGEILQSIFEYSGVSTFLQELHAIQQISSHPMLFYIQN